MLLSFFFTYLTLIVLCQFLLKLEMYNIHGGLTNSRHSFCGYQAWYKWTFCIKGIAKLYGLHNKLLDSFAGLLLMNEPLLSQNNMADLKKYM